MWIALQVAIALGSVAALLLVMLVVKRMARRFDWPPELQRKLVHIATGLYALTLPWLFPDRWPVYMLVGISLVVLMALRVPWVANHGIGSTLHSVERQSWGDILLTLAVGMTFFLSGEDLILFVLPMAVLTLADAAAALAGTAYGKRFFAVEDGRKSVEGAAIFFMVTLIVSMICLLLLTDVPRPNVIALGLAVAALGTLIEAESWRGLDNFFLPVGLMIYLYANLQTGIGGLAGELLLLAMVLVAFHFLGRRLNFGPLGTFLLGQGGANSQAENEQGMEKQFHDPSNAQELLPSNPILRSKYDHIAAFRTISAQKAHECGDQAHLKMA